MGRSTFYVGIIMVGVCSFLLAQQENAEEPPVYDETILQPIHYEELEYPPLARQANIQGAVVIRAKLDDEGRVLSATLISGPRILVGPALANIRKWQFRPNRDKPYDTVVLIYDFRFEGYCVSEAPCRSFFTFRPRNIAVITAGKPLVDHGFSW